jgi:hypothetical protein
MFAVARIISSKVELLRNIGATVQFIQNWDEPNWYWKCQLPLQYGNGPYCLNHDGHMQQFTHFDSRGVVLRNYGKGIGCVATPVRVGAYALGLWNQSKGTDARILDRFLKQSNHLLDEVVNNGSLIGGIPYKLKWPYFRLPVPFYSAIGQGYGISVMLRSYHLTNEVKYLEAAKRMAQFLAVPVEEGGVCRSLDNRTYFYEEAPTRKRPSFILNGHFIALIGLWELQDLDDNGMASSLFELGLRGLLWKLKDFDLGKWSLYDLYDTIHPNWASVTYHNLHACLLKIAIKTWGLSELWPIEQNWIHGLKSRKMRLKATLLKILHKVRRY